MAVPAKTQPGSETGEPGRGKSACPAAEVAVGKWHPQEDVEGVASWQRRSVVGLGPLLVIRGGSGKAGPWPWRSSRKPPGSVCLLGSISDLKCLQGEVAAAPLPPVTATFRELGFGIRIEGVLGKKTSNFAQLRTG